MTLLQWVNISVKAAAIIYVLLSSISHAGGNILANYTLHDLSHLVPLFEPVTGTRTQSDINKPVDGSLPVAGSRPALLNGSHPLT